MSRIRAVARRLAHPLFAVFLPAVIVTGLLLWILYGVLERSEREELLSREQTQAGLLLEVVTSVLDTTVADGVFLARSSQVHDILVDEPVRRVWEAAFGRIEVFLEARHAYNVIHVFDLNAEPQMTVRRPSAPQSAVDDTELDELAAFSLRASTLPSASAVVSPFRRYSGNDGDPTPTLWVGLPIYAAGRQPVGSLIMSVSAEELTERAVRLHGASPSTGIIVDPSGQSLIVSAAEGGVRLGHVSEFPQVAEALGRPVAFSEVSQGSILSLRPVYFDELATRRATRDVAEAPRFLSQLRTGDRWYIGMYLDAESLRVEEEQRLVQFLLYYAGLIVAFAVSTVLIARADRGRRRVAARLEEAVVDLEAHRQMLSSLKDFADVLQACNTEQEIFTVFGRFAAGIFPKHNGRLTTRAYLQKPHRAADESDDSDTPPDSPDTEGERVEWSHDSSQYNDEVGISVPLIAEGHELGRLDLSPVSSRGRIDSEILTDIATSVATRIALTVANRRLQSTLQYTSVRDELTGLFNRRFLIETLRQSCSHIDRAGGALTVLLFDIDFFKRFNDTYGHDAGDAVLRGVADLMERTFRDSDVPGRYGGEEFLVIMHDTEPSAAVKRAEAFRRSLEESEFSFREQTLRVTATIGVAGYPTDAEDATAVVTAADEALYDGKKAGRNRVAYS